jgi:hypothetical protein
LSVTGLKLVLNALSPAAKAHCPLSCLRLPLAAKSINRKIVLAQPPTIIARAFELARDGSCQTSTQIRTILVHEGYEHVHQHLTSPTVVKQLKKLLREHTDPTTLTT